MVGLIEFDQAVELLVCFLPADPIAPLTFSLFKSAKALFF